MCHSSQFKNELSCSPQVRIYAFASELHDIQQRSYCSVLLKHPTFIRHLHEQARALQVPTNQPPIALRTQIRDALKSRLAALGWATDGENPQLRERLRMAEIMVRQDFTGLDARAYILF